MNTDKTGEVNWIKWLKKLCQNKFSGINQGGTMTEEDLGN
jgi:hypothetical protein